VIPVARTVATLVVSLAIAACGTAASSAVVRPSTPPGWVTVASDAGDVRLDLPPWIEPFETADSVLANEPPRVDGTWIQLLATGPVTARRPSASEADARRWIEDQIGSPAAGVATVRRMELPGGSAIRIDRVDDAGTPRAWRLAAFAFQTPIGLAALVIDGPPGAWEGREDDLELIPMLVRFGLGQAGSDPVQPHAGDPPMAPRAGDPPVSP
jgi:hypothetical protein